jgi:hypothetical protein
LATVGSFAANRSADRRIMLKWLKRWLGWDSDASLFDFGDLPVRPPVTPRSGHAPPAPGATKTTARPAAVGAPVRRDKPKSRAPADILDNPSLTLDKPTDDGFDPYNTGAFNRSASWEKIGRQRKR